jgi:hypothetical protein
VRLTYFGDVRSFGDVIEVAVDLFEAFLKDMMDSEAIAEFFGLVGFFVFEFGDVVSEVLDARNKGVACSDARADLRKYCNDLLAFLGEQHLSVFDIFECGHGNSIILLAVMGKIKQKKTDPERSGSVA